MHTVFDVANTFIKMANEDNVQDMTNMKLQKLCYFAQAYSIAGLDKPVFNDVIVAHYYGPIIPNLYDEIAKQERYVALKLPIAKGDEIQANDEFYPVLKFVFEKFGHKSAWNLSEITHQPGTPWSNTNRLEPITMQSIKEYYEPRQ